MPEKCLNTTESTHMAAAALSSATSSSSSNWHIVASDSVGLNRC